MNRVEIANDKLYQKMKAEFDSFINTLKDSSPDTIIEKSYEKVFKEEILGLFENGIHLDVKQAKAILATKSPLETFYQDWLKADCSYLDSLKDCIDERVEKAVKAMELKAEKNRESR